MTLRGCSRIFALSSLSARRLPRSHRRRRRRVGHGEHRRDDRARDHGRAHRPTRRRRRRARRHSPTATGDSSTSDGTHRRAARRAARPVLPRRSTGRVRRAARRAARGRARRCCRWCRTAGRSGSTSTWTTSGSRPTTCCSTAAATKKCPGDPGYTTPDMGRAPTASCSRCSWPGSATTGRPTGCVTRRKGWWAKATGYGRGRSAFRQGESTLAIVAIEHSRLLQQRRAGDPRHADRRGHRDRLPDRPRDAQPQGPGHDGPMGRRPLPRATTRRYRQQVRETIVAGRSGTFKDIREVGSMRVGEVDVDVPRQRHGQRSSATRVTRGWSTRRSRRRTWSTPRACRSPRSSTTAVTRRRCPTCW